jgi:glycosyltransferase involved in cell wall biosynthesis
MNKLIRITTVPISLDKLLDRQMSFMKDYYSVIAVSSDDTYLKKIGKKDGVETFYVEMTRKITPLKDIKAVWKLYCFFKEEKPFIVHSHTPKAGTVGMIAARLANIPYRLHTVAGLPLLETKGNKRKLLNLVEKITYKCATHVWPNSYGLKNIIIDKKLCPPFKLKVISNGSSNGINTSYFAYSLYGDNSKKNLKKELSINENDFVFIFVGRLVTDKGVNELIKAFNTINNQYPDIKLILVGSHEPDLDPLNVESLEIIKQNKNIISVGWQSDVRPYFAVANVLVFPSYREGFPNVVMQAGAMGLPSIVTDINGCNEIIIEGKNGVIIPPKDGEALKEAMISLLTNKEKRERLAAVSRQMIVDRYEQKMVWDALLAEYKHLEVEYESKHKK